MRSAIDGVDGRPGPPERCGSEDDDARSESDDQAACDEPKADADLERGSEPGDPYHGRHEHPDHESRRDSVFEGMPGKGVIKVGGFHRLAPAVSTTRPGFAVVGELCSAFHWSFSIA